MFHLSKASLFTLALLGGHASASAILFPMYIYPKLQDVETPCAAWSGVIERYSLFSDLTSLLLTSECYSIKSHQNLAFYLVINGVGENGPGPANSQPNTDWTPCIPQLKNASSKVTTLGYVHVRKRPGEFELEDPTVVETNITTYANWNISYRPDGIFFDESPSVFENVTRMDLLVSHARKLFGPDSPVRMRLDFP